MQKCEKCEKERKSVTGAEVHVTGAEVYVTGAEST